MLNRPIKFAPRYKSVIWGGDKIAKYKGVDTGIDNVGESWEISAVHGSESVVVDPPTLEGLTLNELVDKYGEEILGKDVVHRCRDGFPLLIKIIDAQSNLSVQVHPNDELAKKRCNSKGKTEMWYIIDAEDDAKIYCGLSKAISPDDYVKLVADNTIMDVVAEHQSAPGQFYFVPAGTIHAIGAGNLLAEVQQSSDITYRVYDYDRRDANGNPRELHTELAKDAIDYRFPNDFVPNGQVVDVTTKGVVKCEYFTVDFLNLSAADSYTVDNKSRTFSVLMCTAGKISITMPDDTVYTYNVGETVLLPASMSACTLSGAGKALLVTC